MSEKQKIKDETWSKTKACIDYFEELGNAHRSLSIEAYLTNSELMALIRELLCSADCETEV